MSRKEQSVLHIIMSPLRKLMPSDTSGENTRAVQVFDRILRFKDIIYGKILGEWIGKNNWPVTSGSFIVSDKSASIAVCTLTSPELMKPLSTIDRVAITGKLVTVNLGIEKIILNTISNPNIRFLLLCGKESPVFHPAQALQCLFWKGIDTDRRIKEAIGHYPVLNNIGADRIERFRQQVELINYTNELDKELLRKEIAKLDQRKKPPFPKITSSMPRQPKSSPDKQFRKIRLGGKRGTPIYDPNGFFVITVDHEAGKIVLQHYLPDNTTAHEMRGRRAESIIRGLLREKLVSQLSHAGYLGVELAKAEIALRLGLDYEQDHPINKPS